VVNKKKGKKAKATGKPSEAKAFSIDFAVINKFGLV